MSYNNSNKLNTARRNKLMQIQEREGAKTANPASRQKLQKMLFDKLCKKYGDGGAAEAQIEQMVDRFMRTTSKVDPQKLNELEDNVKNAVAGRSLALTNMPSSSGSGRLPTGRERNQALASARRELRSRGGGSSRPSSRQGSGRYLKDSASANSLKTLGFNIGNGADTGSEGEWLVLAAYNKMQYEKEQKDYMAKIKEDQKVQEKYLDKQMYEQKSVVQKEKTDEYQYYTIQERELAKWKEDEIAIKEKISRKNKVEKSQREEQIQLNREQRNTALKQQRIDEEKEIERCRRAMEAEKTQMMLSKTREKEKLRDILEENKINQKEHLRQMEKEAKEDVELMRQYAEKLRKQDEDREMQFKKTQHTVEANTGAAQIIKEKEIQKEKKLMATIEKYRQEKDAADAARDNHDRQKRKQDGYDRKKTLDEQLRLQREAEDEQRKIDQRYAAKSAADGARAMREEEDKQARRRRAAKDHQQGLLAQIDAQKRAAGAPANSLDKSVEVGGMSYAERRFNEKLLKSIVDDPYAKQSIEEMLSKGRPSSSARGHQLSNVF